MTTRIPLEKARNVLFLIWLISFLVCFIILMVQTLAGTYQVTTESGLENQTNKVWSWFIPLTIPTLSLMIGVMGVSSLKTEKQGTIKKNFFQFAKWLSLFYLVIVVAVILSWPFLNYENPIDVYSISSFFITPLQGIIIALIGYLFTAKS